MPAKISARKVVFMWGTAPREGFNRYFSGFFASISEVFILAGGGGGVGRWAISLSGLDTFLIFTNFLGLKVLSRLATRIYHVYK